jgi:hypothetical protein
MCQIYRPLWFLLLAVSIVSTSTGARPQAVPNKIDVGVFTQFLLGSYRLIGKEAGTNKTFLGEMVIRKRGNRLQILRTVGGLTVRGFGKVEPSAKAGDLALLPCLRIQFKTAKGRFEGTYLWLSDPDNYARLTGYVYPSNAPNGPLFRNPGLEVLFPDDPLNR